jgi:hypothetical protein
MGVISELAVRYVWEMTRMIRGKRSGNGKSSRSGRRGYAEIAKGFVLAWALVAAVGYGVAQVPATAATQAPREDAAVTALALKIYGQMRAGKVDAALLTPEMSRALSPEALAQTKPLMDQLGDPTKITLESTGPTAGGTKWVYVAVFAAAQLHVTLVVMADGKVGGYTLAL